VPENGLIDGVPSALTSGQSASMNITVFFIKSITEVRGGGATGAV
jgi:hypothetical protein